MKKMYLRIGDLLGNTNWKWLFYESRDHDRGVYNDTNKI